MFWGIFYLFPSPVSLQTRHRSIAAVTKTERFCFCHEPSGLCYRFVLFDLSFFLSSRRWWLGRWRAFWENIVYWWWKYSDLEPFVEVRLQHCYLCRWHRCIIYSSWPRKLRPWPNVTLNIVFRDSQRQNSKWTLNFYYVRGQVKLPVCSDFVQLCPNAWLPREGIHRCLHFYIHHN